MNHIINAKDFYNDFIETTKNLSLKTYKNNFLLTSYIKDSLKDLITKKYHLICINEYYRIDTIAYKQLKNDDLIKNSKTHELNAYLWDLKIAIEYENNKYDWLDELIKLSFIKCPLKVLIIYNFFNKRNDALLGDKAKINYAKTLLKNLNKDDYKDEQYLFIFGNASGKDTDLYYNEKNYCGYLINENGDIIDL